MKLAIIPARGGSKRIPGKNIREFLGKPVIAYSIEAALGSDLFDKVIVSTDDEKIAEVAQKYGAEVPFMRPSELADDFTGTNAVVKHAVQWFVDRKKNVDYACCIYATAPMLQAKYIKEGFEKLVDANTSFAFSVTRFEFPIQRALRISNEGCIEAIYPDHIFTRSQDLEDAYHDAGQFYWGKASAFLNDEVTYSSASAPVILPNYLVQDIDTIDDWKRAELMFEAMEFNT